jgi:hypothetical protein
MPVRIGARDSQRCKTTTGLLHPRTRSPLQNPPQLHWTRAGTMHAVWRCSGWSRGGWPEYMTRRTSRTRRFFLLGQLFLDYRLMCASEGTSRRAGPGNPMHIAQLFCHTVSVYGETTGTPGFGIRDRFCVSFVPLRDAC